MHQHDVERQAACQLSVTYEQRNTWTAALTGTIQDFRVIIRNKAVFFWLLSRRPLFFHSHAYQTVKRYVFYKNTNKMRETRRRDLSGGSLGEGLPPVAAAWWSSTSPMWLVEIEEKGERTDAATKERWERKRKDRKRSGHCHVGSPDADSVHWTSQRAMSTKTAFKTTERVKLHQF